MAKSDGRAQCLRETRCAAWGLVLLLLLACGAEAPAPSAPTASAKPSEAQKLGEPPTALVVPAGNLRGDPVLGERIYAMYCATCHGPGGRGDGPIAATLLTQPAAHSSAEYMGTLSDAQLYLVIQKGGASVGKSSLMAPWGGILNDGDIRDVIAHVRSLSGT